MTIFSAVLELIGVIDGFIIDRVAQPIADKIQAAGYSSLLVVKYIFLGSLLASTVVTAWEISAGIADIGTVGTVWFGSQAVGLMLLAMINRDIRHSESRSGFLPTIRITAFVPRFFILMYAAAALLNLVIDATGLTSNPPVTWYSVYWRLNPILLVVPLYLWACRHDPPAMRDARTVASAAG